MREMEEWNPVPVGSPVGQNEIAAPNSSHTTTERTNRRQKQAFRMARKMGFAGLGKYRGEVVRVW
jgi:hypothetical protein